MPGSSPRPRRRRDVSDVPSGFVYPAMLPAIRLARRLLPAAVRARIRQLLFEWLDLTWPLPTGVRIRVAHYGDWAVYNEIFVNGEYDEAIAKAVDLAGNRPPLHIVDLGANVGFFTLRAVDRLRRRGVDTGLAITAIEADEACTRTFQQRVCGDNGLAGNVRVVRAAVGERTGVALLREALAHFPHGRLSTIRERRPAAGTSRPAISGAAERPEVQVPYVDLSTLLASVPQIDLLKCDIEGSEQPLIENYPDLFRKVRMAVFEFHRDLCDVDRCQALLREYGFEHHATFRPGATYFTYGVWREAEQGHPARSVHEG